MNNAEWEEKYNEAIQRADFFEPDTLVIPINSAILLTRMLLTESIAQAIAEERKRVRGNLPEIKASPLSMLLNDCPICGQVINRSFVDDLTCRIQDEYKQKILSSLDKLTDK